MLPKYENNNKMTLKYFQWLKWKKYGKFKKPEISIFFYKAFVISIICGKCGSKHKRIFKEEESIQVLKILDLIKNKWLLNKYGETKCKPSLLNNKKKLMKYNIPSKKLIK